MNFGEVAERLKALHPAKAGQAANVAGFKDMPYAYILQDKISGKYYTGSCLELSTRLARHKNHTGGQTTRNGEWQLVSYKIFDDIAEARRIEKLVKSYKGGEAFRRIVSGQDETWRGGRAA